MDKLETLKKVRENNFMEIGQCLLQKKYYEDMINNLLVAQEKICDDIFKLERGGK